MRITNMQVYPIKEPKGTNVAYARVLLDDCLQITGIKLNKDYLGGFTLLMPYTGGGGEPLFQLDHKTEADVLNAVVNEYRLNGGA